MVLDHITCLGVAAVDGADFAEMVGVVNTKLAVLNPVVAVGHWILSSRARCSLQLQGFAGSHDVIWVLDALPWSLVEVLHSFCVCAGRLSSLDLLSLRFPSGAPVTGRIPVWGY